MPEWLWSIVVGLGVIGLLVALRRSDMDRISELEKWKKDKEAFDYKFRHDEYSKTIMAINSELWPLVRQVSAMEKRVDRLDHRIFNGNPK